jgi:hypothetical protein
MFNRGIVTFLRAFVAIVVFELVVKDDERLSML